MIVLMMSIFWWSCMVFLVVHEECLSFRMSPHGGPGLHNMAKRMPVKNTAPKDRKLDMKYPGSSEEYDIKYDGPDSNVENDFKFIKRSSTSFINLDQPTVISLKQGPPSPMRDEDTKDQVRYEEDAGAHEEELQRASAHEILEHLKTLEREGHDLSLFTNAYDEEGFTPLHHAITQKEASNVEILLSVGKADPNLPTITNSPKTCLQLALETSPFDEDLFSSLIFHGANYTIPVNEKGYLPLHVLASMRDEKGAFGAIYSLLTWKEETRALVNSTTKDNDQTALMLTVEQGMRETSMLLLEMNTNLNHQDVDGNTALHLASRANNNTDIIYHLFRHGARWQLKKKNLKGETPLDMAKKNKKLKSEHLDLYTQTIPGGQSFHISDVGDIDPSKLDGMLEHDKFPHGFHGEL